MYSGISFLENLATSKYKIKCCVLFTGGTSGTQRCETPCSVTTSYGSRSRGCPKGQSRGHCCRGQTFDYFSHFRPKMTNFFLNFHQKLMTFLTFFSGWTKSITSFKRCFRYYLWISDCLATEISANIKQYISWEEFNNYFSLACGNNGQFRSMRR